MRTVYRLVCLCIIAAFLMHISGCQQEPDYSQIGYQSGREIGQSHAHDGMYLGDEQNIDIIRNLTYRDMKTPPAEDSPGFAKWKEGFKKGYDDGFYNR
jgi:hypothetical protein